MQTNFYQNWACHDIIIIIIITQQLSYAYDKLVKLAGEMSLLSAM
jgi:hypothetical protein